MRCRWKKLISRFIDGELNKEEKEFMENHIRGCDICSQELRFLKMIKDNLNKDFDYQIDSSFRQNVISELTDIQTNFKRRFNLWLDDIYTLAKRLIPAFTVVLLLIVFSFVFRQQSLAVVTIEDVLINNHLTKEEEFILGNDELSPGVILGLFLNGDNQEGGC
ncbi:MAG TPA: hypothetical protein ENG55_02950 [Candidatus Omnitrophica bacterium]|nr:hypothetical protein [Candidatus Omnitrophota bacterium]